MKKLVKQTSIPNNSHCIIIQADGLNFAKEMLLSTAESATYSAAEVERRLHSDLRCGLSWQEALSRSKIIGYNELRAQQEDSTIKKYVEQFKNPLILLLLGMMINFIHFSCIHILAHFSSLKFFQ